LLQLGRTTDATEMDISHPNTQWSFAQKQASHLFYETNKAQYFFLFGTNNAAISCKNVGKDMFPRLIFDFSVI